MTTRLTITAAAALFLGGVSAADAAERLLQEMTGVSAAALGPRR